MEQTIIDFFNQATIITVGCKHDDISTPQNCENVFKNIKYRPQSFDRIANLISNAEYAKISFNDLSCFILVFSTTRKGKSTHGMAYSIHIDKLTTSQLRKLGDLVNKSESQNKS